MKQNEAEHGNGRESQLDCQERKPLRVVERRIDLEQYAETIPKLYRSNFLKSQTERSPTRAIKAKCQECCGFEDVANRVSECSCFKCPLWPYRPYQDKSESEE